MSRILFASSEVHPLVKTGGLGDVSGSLPPVLQSLGEDIRLVLPAYRQVLRQLTDLQAVAQLHLPAAPAPVRILQGRLPGTDVTLWLIDSPVHFDRDGGPYLGPDGHDWPDNAARFALFSRAIVELAQDRAGLNWRADIVHCNDWQTGLVPALLQREPQRPGTVFTIHNLAYQGLFAWDTFAGLALPSALWHMDAMEFYNNLSFLKGGLAFADWITTVSPTYAKEICTPAYGYGLEGLLTHRSARLRGILNGVDYSTWDPDSDPLIPHHYSAESLAGKAGNKRALQERFSLLPDAKTPLIGLVGRMVEQKGVDLVVETLPQLLEQPLQVAVVGTGSREYEQQFAALALRYPGQVGVFIGYDEALAHLVEAGADMFLMPSRFEPCGLNQMFSLRYGTVPIVRQTGGLADTVVHADKASLKDGSGSATGFSFQHADTEGLLWAVGEALALYAQPRQWQQLMRNGMTRDHSWQESARQYQELYRELLK